MNRTGSTPLVGLLTIGLAILTPEAPRCAAQVLSFSDQTDAAGLTSTHQIASPLITRMVSGGAAADFDEDGHQDLFVAMGGVVADRLFMNDADGTFTDRAADWNVDRVHVGGGTAVGDYDGDGRLDLFVASHGPAEAIGPGAHLLYHNDGGSFSEVAAAAGVAFASPHTADGYGAAFGDMDIDGDLDLFVAGWVATPTSSEGNRLFANQGDGTFTDVTSTAIDTDLTVVHGFTPQFVDMDDDGYPELLLASDFETSRYLVNDGDGTFSDATASSGTGLDSNGMGAAVADFDGDGRLDWYVTSIHGDGGAGHHADASGNMLYLNQGAHVYSEVSVAAGVNDGGWGWGCVAVDFDHDGWVDIAETNGWGTPDWVGEQSYLFMNDGDGTFSEQAAACGLTHALSGRGMVAFDADDDGDRDLAIFAWNDALAFFRNDLTGASTGWITIDLDAVTSPDAAPDGIGARVSVTAGGQTQVRAVEAGGSYISAVPHRAHFGVGDATSIDEVRIEWPHGTVTQLRDLAVGQRLDVDCCPGWTDLAGGVASASGVPQLAGDGTLAASDPVTLTLSGAPPSALAYFVLGVSLLDAPFKGGRMIPSVDVIAPLTVDPAGEIGLGFAWPPGIPADAHLYYQYWIPDASGPLGFLASNGLRSTTP